MGSDFLALEEEKVVQGGSSVAFSESAACGDRLFRLKHFPKPLPDQDGGKAVDQGLVYLAVQSSFRLSCATKPALKSWGRGWTMAFPTV